MRTFIALTPSPESLAVLTALQTSLSLKKSDQLIPAEKLHLTVVFCGDVDKTHVLNLANLLILTDIKRSLVIPTETFALFGHGNAKRLVLNMKNTPLIHTLHKITTHEIERAGIPIEKNRTFNPHITLAKIGAQTTLPTCTIPETISFSKLVLLESVLSAKGSTFTPLAQITLQ